MHAPGECAVVNCASACLIAVIQYAHRVRSHAGMGPPGDGLALPVWAKLLPLEVTQFIMRIEIRGAKARAALQANDFHSRFAKLGREDSPDRAHANNDDICFFGCHGYPLPIGPLDIVCRPTMGSRVNACLLWRSVGVNTACAPGKPTSRQPVKSLFPP